MREEDSGRNREGFREILQQSRIFFTNQKLSGMSEVTRGVVVKELSAMPNERIDFSQCKKALAENGVILHSVHWNKRCENIHNPEVQKQ